MKRTWLIAGILAASALALAPQPSQAHGWRHWGCGSYYRGYSYYSPRYYSSYYNPGYYSYNSWSPYSGGYGSYCSSSYSPYSSYGYYPSYGYPSYGYPQYGYSAYGGMAPGMGGGSLLGMLAGGNLTGSLMQPSYLSMPVSMGYGQPGYLQVPMGANSGRASYLQIPVNSGYGPASYIQIELGRNANAAAPAPSAAPSSTTAPPFGAAPGASADAINRLTYAIPKTATDEVPPVVMPLERASTAALASASADAVPAKPGPTSSPSKFQLLSYAKAAKPADAAARKQAPVAKDTSFSLVEDEPADGARLKSGNESSLAQEIVADNDREFAPWVAK